MADQWFAILDGVEIGPLPASQIRQLAESGKIGPTTPVKRQGMERFIPASRVNGLISVVVEQGQPVSTTSGAGQPTVITAASRGNVADTLRPGNFFQWYEHSAGRFMVESLFGRISLIFMALILIPMSLSLFSSSIMTDNELRQEAFEKFKRGDATTAMVDQFLNPQNCSDYRKWSLVWGVFFIIPGAGFAVIPILSTIALHLRQK